MKNKYTHLTKDERDQLAVLRSRGLKLRDIGTRLGRNPSTLSRELTRNRPRRGRQDYLPHKAQARSEQRHRESHKRMRLKSRVLRHEAANSRQEPGHWESVSSSDEVELFFKIRSKGPAGPFASGAYRIKQLLLATRRSNPSFPPSRSICVVPSLMTMGLKIQNMISSIETWGCGPTSVNPTTVGRRAWWKTEMVWSAFSSPKNVISITLKTGPFNKPKTGSTTGR